MFNIFIVSRGGGAVRIMRNTVNGKVSLTEYEAVVPASEKASTRINALAGVIHTLRQLHDSRDKISGIVNIYTVRLVSDPVQRGTFKYWLLDGKTSDGQELSQTELELWEEFVGLYKDMFEFINIKDVSSTAIPKAPRFRVSREQQVLAKLASMAWDKCPEPATVDENNVADLEEIPF
jgi:hypothetical protein